MSRTTVIRTITTTTTATVITDREESALEGVIAEKAEPDDADCFPSPIAIPPPISTSFAKNRSTW